MFFLTPQILCSIRSHIEPALTNSGFRIRACKTEDQTVKALGISHCESPRLDRDGISRIQQMEVPIPYTHKAYVM